MKKYFTAIQKSKLSKILSLALIAASLISFVASTEAASTHSLTVNVTDACGPVVAQVTVVNGPDDGAFGITNSNGQFVFPALNDGVFYLHIAAAGHASKSTGAIVLTSNQTVNISLDRLDPSCGSGPTNPVPGTHNLTVNVTDVCGPVVAQVTVVNGPDDGAFGITNSNGQFTFTNLHDGVFYLHIAATNHASKDTGAIVFVADQTVNVSLDRTNGGCPGNPIPTPTCEDPNATNFGGPLPCAYPPTGPTNNPPAGVLDAATCELIGGWAVDNDTPNQAVTIEVYMDGPAGSGTLVATVQANLPRADVGNHAFHIQPLPAQLRNGQSHTVHVYMLDTTSGAKSLLTNGVKTIPACGTPPTPTNRPPVGVFDAATCEIIGGWAFDQDEPSRSIVVEIYANGPQGIGTRIFSGATTGLRPDVNSQYGITGNHGFTISTPASLKDGGTHEIWVYAQDTATNVNTLFDNRKIFNSASCIPPSVNHAPTGVLDVANCEIIGGWAVDMDTPTAGVLVDLYYDGPAGSGTFLATVPSNTPRADVNAQFGITGNHGFTINTPAVLKDTRSHTIYAYAIDTDPSRALNFHLINSPKTIPACVTTPTQGTINLIKLVRNVTAGQASFGLSTAAVPGDQVEFQMQVSALGNAVTNVVLSDTLPSRLTYVNNSLTVDGAPSGNTLTGLNLSTINASQTKTVVLRATVAAASQFSAGTTTLTNTANVTSSSNSMQASANVNVTMTPAAGSATLSKLVRNVSQGQNVFVSTTSANPGETVEFQIRATAVGGAVSSVVLSDVLPARLNYVANSLIVEGATGLNDLASINLASLSVDQTKTVTFRATVAAASQFGTGNTVLTNVASIPATGVTASASVAVNLAPTNVTLSIVKLARNVSQGQTGFSKNISANPGDTVQFQLQVTNTGVTLAQNVRVDDTLPANLSLASGSNITFNLGSMNAGSSQTVSLSAVVAGESSFACGGNTIFNVATAQATSSNFPSDNASISVNRNCNPNNNTTLSVTKEVRNVTTNTSFGSSTNAAVGQQVQFRLTVRNVGNNTANNVRISDLLPNGLVYVPGTFQVDSGASSGNLFAGNQFLGNIFPNQSRVLTFSATVNAGAGQTITNVAQAFADNANSTNGQASVFVGSVLGGNVDLVLSKRAFNQTQNVNALQVTARSGDLIVYTLSVRNQGNVTATNYVFQDSLADVLQLSMLQDFGGASFDLATLTLTWPQVNIEPGQTLEKTFSVRVNNTFPAGSDNVMTNIFGNTINVAVLKPAVAGATAPPTGATTNLIFAFSALSIAGFAAYRRKEQLKSLFASNN